jgi:hypothetical protein
MYIYIYTCIYICVIIIYTCIYPYIYIYTHTGNPDFKIHLSNVKAVDEVHALQTFHNTLSSDPDKACYAYPHCLYAGRSSICLSTLMPFWLVRISMEIDFITH